jgi:hypothetical protein
MSRLGLRRKLLSLKKNSIRASESTASHSETATRTPQADIDTTPRWVARNQQRLFYQTALYAPMGPTLADTPSIPSIERPKVAYPEYLARRLRRRDECAEEVNEDDKNPRVLVAVIGHDRVDDWDERDDMIETASFL